MQARAMGSILKTWRKGTLFEKEVSKMETEVPKLDESRRGRRDIKVEDRRGRAGPRRRRGDRSKEERQHCEHYRAPMSPMLDRVVPSATKDAGIRVCMPGGPGKGRRPGWAGIRQGVAEVSQHFHRGKVQPIRGYKEILKVIRIDMRGMVAIRRMSSGATTAETELFAARRTLLNSGMVQLVSLMVHPPSEDGWPDMGRQ